MTKNQDKSKAQKGSKKKATSSNFRASSHQPKPNKDISQTPSTSSEEGYYPDDREAEYTWTPEPEQEPEPETRISTPSYISYTDNQASQAPDYRADSTWNQEQGPNNHPAHQTPSWSQTVTAEGGQYRAHNTTYTQSTTNHSTNYAASQAQPCTRGPPSVFYPPHQPTSSAAYPPQQPTSSAPYQAPYPPSTEYPSTIPQLDSWVNETSSSKMTVTERLTGRHYC